MITIDTLKERPLSYSSIKEFQKSPRHYLEYINKQRTPPTDAMKLGSMVHCMILQPNLFNEQFVIAPDVNKRTNAGKEEWAAFCSQHADKTVVSNEDYEHASRLASGAMANPTIESLVKNCYDFEQEWRANIDGLPYRGFYDGIADEYVLEIKTTSDGLPRSVMNDFIKRKYHVQAGLYNLVSQKQVVYIIIETSEPYLSYSAPASDQFLELGLSDLSKANKKFMECLEAGDFSGGYDYGKEIVIDLPWTVEK
jgi:hypothetical protein